MSYKDILKNHRKKHHKKYYKPNLTTLGNKNDGLECDKFDDVINEDLYFFLTFDNIPELKKNSNVETIRRLNLLKIAKQLNLNRNNYFNLHQKSFDQFKYSYKDPKLIENFELERLMFRQRYLQFLNKQLLVNDIRTNIFNKIAKNLWVDQYDIQQIKLKTQHINTATSSSNAILSHIGSRDQERVKDSRLRQNKTLEKYQHNSKWLLFYSAPDSKSQVYQLPKMSGKYHTEFCLRYFISNCIKERNLLEHSLYTTENIINILLDIREFYNKTCLKILKDNVINIFEGLNYDMQCLLAPSLDNIKNLEKAKAIRKIVNLPIHRNKKIEKLYNYSYINKFGDRIYPFNKYNKYRIIINSSYHYVKDTSLLSNKSNPNCISDKFLSKFKLCFGIYQVSSNCLLYNEFQSICNQVKKKETIISSISTLISNIYFQNEEYNKLHYSINLINHIRYNKSELNYLSPITEWLRQFLEFSPMSIKLYGGMFDKTLSNTINIYKNFKHSFKIISDKEVKLRKKIVNDYLKTKEYLDNQHLFNCVITNIDKISLISIKDIKNKLISISKEKIVEYFENYFKMISACDLNNGYMLLNHMLQHLFYILDTESFNDTFNLKIMNNIFSSHSSNYKGSNNKHKKFAFPMYTKIFGNILKSKRKKVSDGFNIIQDDNITDQVDDIIFESDSEMPYELDISE